MNDYQSIQDKAGELYALIDKLAEIRNAQHREAEALALYNAKLQIQKILGVPPKIAAAPVVTPVIEQTAASVPTVFATVDAPEPIHYGTAVPKDNLPKSANYPRSKRK